MSHHDITFIPDPDADSISSDVAGFAGLLVSTQIPTRADGSLELGGIVEQSECTLQALKLALEKAGSSMSRVLHLTIYLTDMADRAAFNEVYKRYFAQPWPVRAAVGVAELAGSSWSALPPDIRDAIPHAQTIALVLFVLVPVARIFKRKGPDDGE